jgi:hypothetical protein
MQRMMMSWLKIMLVRRRVWAIGVALLSPASATTMPHGKASARAHEKAAGRSRTSGLGDMSPATWMHDLPDHLCGAKLGQGMVGW